MSVLKKLLVLSLLFGASSAIATTSLSDLNFEASGAKWQAGENRNPFQPAGAKETLRAQELVFEGFVIGEKIKIVLLSGRMLLPGSTLGPYEVTAIEPGKVILKDSMGEVPLLFEEYLSPMQADTRDGFQIEFRGANIKDALSVLSKAYGVNLILPPDIQGVVTVSFHNTSLLNAIKSILKVNNFSYAMEGGILRVGKPDQFAGGTDLLAVTIPLKYATAKDLVEQVKPLLSEKGSATAVERSNVLSVKDYEANIGSVRELVERVDQQDHQVLIEAHIIDATKDYSQALGIQWGGTGTSDALTIAGAAATGTLAIGGFAASPTGINLGAPSPTSGVGFRIGRIAGGHSLAIQLTAAEKNGDVKILSKPRVTTLNNKPAKISSGVKLYVKSTSNISIGTSGGSAGASQPSLQVIETGVQLTVTPQISPDKMIKLVIEAHESEADFARSVDGIPAVLDNTATTTVFLKDGESAVIGGLLKTKDTITKQSVPGISKVPLIGLLFKSRSKAQTQNELMIFITPKILEI